MQKIEKFHQNPFKASTVSNFLASNSIKLTKSDLQAIAHFIKFMTSHSA